MPSEIRTLDLRDFSLEVAHLADMVVIPNLHVQYAKIHSRNAASDSPRSAPESWENTRGWPEGESCFQNAASPFGLPPLGSVLASSSRLNGVAYGLSEQYKSMDTRSWSGDVVTLHIQEQIQLRVQASSS